MQLDLTGHFQLHMKCSISNTSDGPNAASSPIPAVVLSFHICSPGEGLSSMSNSGVSHSIALLASSITIFFTAVVLVVVVLVVVGLLWRWQARNKRVRSVASCTGGSGATEQREGGGEDGCGSARDHSNTATPARVKLRKSSSTTSFPTVEKLKTNARQQQKTPDDALHSTTSQMTGQIDRYHILSKSLPNLFLASTREGRLGRKRQLRKNVRVKAIYSLQASLDKRRGKGGGREGERDKDSQGLVGGGENDDRMLGRAKEAEGGKVGDSNLHVCVIKNSAAPPVMVRVQPLTGEVDLSRLSTASDLKPEDPTPSTEP